ncbi:hypothetical protein BDV27DRAFT_152941 [Aspergillus caelatus]|uniref:Uncharacterized protein n=1 Tax=Aspergillus caelatus TaxID=61420 RepID=A0A5N7AIF4_9EURO|nr:uncharacterized protein BDV27DRAFT_152941 [Aspergillus caelatus]KAE8369652.1 hypothetical protein BDV27DRAFT_152941 [Aspergillus caelatus]
MILKVEEHETPGVSVVKCLAAQLLSVDDERWGNIPREFSQHRHMTRILNHGPIDDTPDPGMGYTTAGEGELCDLHSMKDVQHSHGFIRGLIATQHTSSSVTTILGRRMGPSAKARSFLHIAECGPSPGERFKLFYGVDSLQPMELADGPFRFPRVGFPGSRL